MTNNRMLKNLFEFRRHQKLLVYGRLDEIKLVPTKLSNWQLAHLLLLVSSGIYKLIITCGCIFSKLSTMNICQILSIINHSNPPTSFHFASRDQDNFCT